MFPSRNQLSHVLPGRWFLAQAIGRPRTTVLHVPRRDIPKVREPAEWVLVAAEVIFVGT
jgi:hypothetical protein